MIIFSSCWPRPPWSAGLSCPSDNDSISSSEQPSHWPSQRIPTIALTLLSCWGALLPQLFSYSCPEARWPSQGSQMVGVSFLSSSWAVGWQGRWVSLFQDLMAFWFWNRWPGGRDRGRVWLGSHKTFDIRLERWCSCSFWFLFHWRPLSIRWQHFFHWHWNRLLRALLLLLSSLS